MDSISTEFSKTISKLVALLERKSRSEAEMANLDRLRQRIFLVKSTTGSSDALIEAASPALLRYTDHITKGFEDAEKFFLSMDVAAEIGPVNAGDEFVFSLIDSIKGFYFRSPADERRRLYNDLLNLHNWSVDWQLAQIH